MFGLSNPTGAEGGPAAFLFSEQWRSQWHGKRFITNI
jgi:hypothetical protein